ncbi:MAG TPA: ABC transporter substrate-binding protein [Acetobacteraceae bacterium]|nr:ABC transporter substrate-binding protein [Acetobacteraceae bacterium]
MAQTRRDFVSGATTLAAGLASRQARASEATISFGLAARSNRTMDPAHTTQGADNWVITQLFDTLVRPEDGTFALTPQEYRPALAESWSVTPDSREWRFRLRPGVKFHKGYGEVTAEDVKFTFDRSRDPVAGASERVLYENIADVIVDDPLSVRFRLKRPDPLFCGTAIHTPGGCILSRRAVTERGDKFGTDPIGTGPYQFDVLDQARGIVLSANPEYFLGPPATPNLQMQYILDTTARTLALLSGKVDMIEGVRAPGWIQSMQQRNGRLAFDGTVPGSSNHVAFNLTRKPFDDIRVRRAFLHAIDRDAIVKALAPMGGRMWGVNPPQYRGSVSDQDLPPELQYRYDPARAKALLAEAGHPNGFAFQTFSSLREDYSSIMLMLQEQLRKVGIAMDLKLLDHTTMQNDSRRDLAIVALRSSSYPPIPLKAFLEQLSAGAEVKGDGNGGSNYSHYGVAIPGIDDQLEAAQNEADFDRLIARVQEMERRVLTDLPLFSVGSLSYVIARNPRVDLGYKVRSGYAYWTLRRAKIIS